MDLDRHAYKHQNLCCLVYLAWLAVGNFLLEKTSLADTVIFCRALHIICRFSDTTQAAQVPRLVGLRPDQYCVVCGHITNVVYHTPWPDQLKCASLPPLYYSQETLPIVSLCLISVVKSGSFLLISFPGIGGGSLVNQMYFSLGVW